MVIQGHRGGFDPENSLQAFQSAIDNGIKSIELDVWLTKDKELIVVHGGDSGEMKFPGAEKRHYVFDMTVEENRGSESRFVLPTLREVFKLTAKKIFINIEMKTPWEEEPRSRYQIEAAAEAVHDLIREYDLNEFCFISSFNHGDRMLQTIDELNTNMGYHVRTVYLYNFYPDHRLPPLEVIVSKGDGINISYEELTQEVVDACHKHNKLVCVWIDASVTSETTEVYKRLIDLGVDSFCSDQPLEITRLRDQLVQNAQVSLQATEMYTDYLSENLIEEESE